MGAYFIAILFDINNLVWPDPISLPYLTISGQSLLFGIQCLSVAMPFVWMEMAVYLRSAILPIPLTACQRGLPQLLNVTNLLKDIGILINSLSLDPNLGPELDKSCGIG